MSRLKKLKRQFDLALHHYTQRDTGVRLNLYEMDITALFEKSCVLFVVLSSYTEGEVEDFFSGCDRCSPLSGTKVLRQCVLGPDTLMELTF